MIGIFVQGSKTLGIGHLSRIVPIYHYLNDRKNEIFVYLYGDELGKAYLNKHNVPFCEYIYNQVLNLFPDIWIFDCTDFYFDKIPDDFYKVSKRILLSPKFNYERSAAFTHAILRSDPFNLPIHHKEVSAQYFCFNDGSFTSQSNKIRIGVAISGSDITDEINILVSFLLNDLEIQKKIELLRVFGGGGSAFVIDRKSPNSYLLDVEIISSLNSLWSFTNDIDLLIVGNGLVIDECIFKGKEFLVYNSLNQTTPIKSGYFNIVNTRFHSDFESLKHAILCFNSSMEGQISNELKYNSIWSDDELKFQNKILEIIQLAY